MGDAFDFIQQYGHAPWDNPCWNDDWEVELRERGYRTVKEWNALGKKIKKEQRGKYLPCARLTVFAESQTEPSLF